MNKIIEAYLSSTWLGLVTNLVTVWVVLALSIFFLSKIGNNLGESTSTSLRDAPWTPPGSVIGAVWFLLYSLMALSLWVLNSLPPEQRTPLKLGVVVLIVFCLVWPLYAFSETSRLPGLLGNLGILLIAVFLLFQLFPTSRPAALMIAPVAVWITVATVSILDSARLYGW